MAKGARNGGAKIYRKNRVTDIKLLPSGAWKVFTENGDIVVNTWLMPREVFVQKLVKWLV